MWGREPWGDRKGFEINPALKSEEVEEYPSADVLKLDDHWFSGLEVS